MAETDIGVVTAADLPDLLPLLRAYCDFYEVAPSDRDLLALCRALIEDLSATAFSSSRASKVEAPSRSRRSSGAGRP